MPRNGRTGRFGTVRRPPPARAVIGAPDQRNVFWHTGRGPVLDAPMSVIGHWEVAFEPTVEATDAKRDDQTTPERPVSDPTLDGMEILKKLKSFDSIYEAAFTASGKRPG